MKRSAIYRFGDSVFDFNARTYVMGILNVTPDSFSDGGRYQDPGRAFERAAEMADQGADVLDIGGESTRPGADPVTPEEEIRRIVPVIDRIAHELKVVVSVDTYKREVARRALDAGAVIVNDITALSDPGMKDVVAAAKASLVLMHMQGTPKTMQMSPEYLNVVGEVKGFLKRQAAVAAEAGISQIVIDPGIGFGKKLDHNIALMRHLDSFVDLGYPILVGPSRKSFLGAILDLPPEERMEGTAAAVTACILNGAAMIRVHDVREMKRVAMVADKIRAAS